MNPDSLNVSISTMPSALTVTFVQSTILNAIANILAQLIDQRNSAVCPLHPPPNPQSITKKNSNAKIKKPTLMIIRNPLH